jgi:hypothetical protein
MLAGPYYGTAKRVNVVIVKRTKTGKDKPRTSVLLEALVVILKDVVSKGLQGKAVINISSGCKKIIVKT